MPNGTQKATTPAAKIENFVIGKLGDKFFRFENEAAVPQTASDVFSTVKVGAMKLDDIGTLYAQVAQVPPKKFNNPNVALESLTYQVKKLPMYDPSAPAPTAPAAKGAAGPKTNTAKATTARKTPDNFELLTPANTEEALKGLAPQAREIITIMTNVVEKKGTTKFLKSDLLNELKIPEVAARLHTRQEPSRILQYYQAKLIGSGFLKVS